MTQVMAPGPLLPLDAPLPKPRSYTLLDAAQLVTPDSERWKAGAYVNPYPAGRPETHDPCSDGTYRVKDSESNADPVLFGSFTVVIGGTCTARSIGPDPTWYNDRLRLWFQAVEATAVERMLVSGDGHSTLGPYLGDSNMEVLGTGAQSAREGIALLEQAIAEVGNGIIHLAPATASWLHSWYQLVKVGQNLYTGLGTPVVVGAGYIDAHPDGTGAMSATEEWAFASDNIQIRRDDIYLIGTDYSQNLDRTDNDYTVYAERDYLLSFVPRSSDSDTQHIQAGVLIDRSTT